MTHFEGGDQWNFGIYPKIGNKINYFGVNMRITIPKKFVIFLK